MTRHPNIPPGAVLMFPYGEWEEVASYITMGPSDVWPDMWRVLSPFGRVIELDAEVLLDPGLHDPLQPPAKA